MQYQSPQDLGLRSSSRFRISNFGSYSAHSAGMRRVRVHVCVRVCVCARAYVAGVCLWKLERVAVLPDSFWCRFQLHIHLLNHRDPVLEAPDRLRQDGAAARLGRMCVRGSRVPACHPGSMIAHAQKQRTLSHFHSHSLTHSHSHCKRTLFLNQWK